jgi:hypothetical protein
MRNPPASVGHVSPDEGIIKAKAHQLIYLPLINSLPIKNLINQFKELNIKLSSRRTFILFNKLYINKLYNLLPLSLL